MDIRKNDTKNSDASSQIFKVKDISTMHAYIVLCAFAARSSISVRTAIKHCEQFLENDLKSAGISIDEVVQSVCDEKTMRIFEKGPFGALKAQEDPLVVTDPSVRPAYLVLLADAQISGITINTHLKHCEDALNAVLSSRRLSRDTVIDTVIRQQDELFNSWVSGIMTAKEEMRCETCLHKRLSLNTNVNDGLFQCANQKSPRFETPIENDDVCNGWESRAGVASSI